MSSSWKPRAVGGTQHAVEGRVRGVDHVGTGTVAAVGQACILAGLTREDRRPEGQAGETRVGPAHDDAVESADQGVGALEIEDGESRRRRIDRHANGVPHAGRVRDGVAGQGDGRAARHQVVVEDMDAGLCRRTTTQIAQGDHGIRDVQRAVDIRQADTGIGADRIRAGLDEGVEYVDRARAAGNIDAFKTGVRDRAPVIGQHTRVV